MNKKLLSLLLFVMAAFTAAFAQETVTVYDGTNTNGYVPVYGLWVDSYNKCEFVMNADQLGDLPAGSILTGLTWYFSSTPTTVWGGNFQIFIKEIDATTLSDFTGTDGATVVWEGPLDGTSGQIALEFNTSYVYEGGNLLIGVYQTQTGTYKSASFYGVETAGASVSGYASSLGAISATQRNFVPKTTFTYTPGGGVIIPKPTNLTVSDLTPNSAKLSWTAGGEETSWQVEYKKAADEEWTTETATATTYDLDALANGTDYNVRIRAVVGTDYSSWVTANFTTPVCDDANKGEVSYVLTDTYGDGWNGNKLQIVYNGTVIEELTITTGGKDEPITGTVSLCYGVDYDLVWVGANYGYECGFVLTDPEGSVIYEFHGTGTSSGGSPTSGVLTTFQINQAQFPRPTNLVVSDITATTAKATWAGAADSYNLRYRPVAQGSYSLDESFEGSVSWGLLDADGDGNSWGLISLEGSSVEQYDGTNIVLYSASWDAQTETDLTPDNWVISPKITLSGELRFGVRDVGYRENYAVYVSTTGTAASDFVPLEEGLTTANAWQEKVYDLSAYEGQQGYIAFRHYNCTGGYLILIDGVKVGEAGAGEQEWTVKQNVESPYTMEGLTPATQYEVQVQGVYADGESEWTTSVNFTTTDGLDVPTNLAISDITHNSAVATWEGSQESYNLRYRTPAKADVLFSESFEGTFPGEWTIVDSDGDGNNWLQFNPLNFTSGGFPAYDGQYAAMSRSWMSTALTPDNWLISPVIEDLGGTLHYFIVDDGANYPETYQIYVSTAEGTELANFVAVTEEMESPNSIQWTELTVDLSAYAGQAGRIAFRNFNCTDKDFMLIDAISITKNEVPAGEWTVVEGVTSPADIEGLDPETEYEVQVQGIFGQNTTAWTESVLFTTLEAPAPEPVITVDVDFGTYEVAQTVHVTVENMPEDATIVYQLVPSTAKEEWTNYDDATGIVVEESAALTVAVLDADGEEIARLEGEYTITPSTGIATIGVDGQNNEWYNLNGQKLSGKPVTPGIYINGNKKVIVR